MQLVGVSTLTKPMSLAYSRKHWRQMFRPYLRIKPQWFAQMRLRGHTASARRAEHPVAREAGREAVRVPTLLCSSSAQACNITIHTTALWWSYSGRVHRVGAVRGLQTHAPTLPELSKAQQSKQYTTSSSKGTALHNELGDAGCAPLAAALAVRVVVAIPYVGVPHGEGGCALTTGQKTCTDRHQA